MDMLLTSDYTSYLAALYPLLLPSAILFAHSYAADISQKTWHTIQHLQDAPPAASEEEAQNDKRRLRFKKIIGLVIACAFLVAEFWVVAEGNEQHVAYLLQALVGITLFTAHFTTLSKLLGSQWVVARRRTGHLSFSLNKPSKWTKAAIAGLVLISTSNVYITLTQPENTPMRLLSIAAIVISLTSRCTAKKTGIRSMTVFFMTYEAVVIALAVMLIIPSYKSSTFNDLFTSTSSTPPSDEDTASPLSPLVNQLFGILVPAFYTAPVGQYLSLLLRFDYSQSRTTLDNQTSATLFETVPAPSRGCRRTNGPGLIIPFSSSSSSLLPQAARNYYSLGLSLTSFIYLFIAPLLHKSLQLYVFPALAQSEYKFLEDQIFAMLAMFITMPVLAIVLGVYAKSRGEGKAFWTYEEAWVKDERKEEEAIQLAGSVSEKQPLIFVERDTAGFPMDRKLPLEV